MNLKLLPNLPRIKLTTCFMGRLMMVFRPELMTVVQERLLAKTI